MSEQIYLQVEDAISRNLYTFRDYRSSGRPIWMRPIRIALGNIVMLYGDCGTLSRQEDLSRWTTDEWAEAARNPGLFRRVGLWSFVRDDDPAASEVSYCTNYPDQAGHDLYDLRMMVSGLQDRIKKLEGGSR